MRDETELVLQRAIDEKIAEPIEQADAEWHLLAVENFFAPAPSECDEKIKYFALERPASAIRTIVSVKKVLVDPRRRESIGGADLAPILHDSLRRFRTVDAIAGGVELARRRKVIANPGQRQISDHFLLLVEAVEGIGVARGDDGVLVGEHHALGAAGRSRSVKDDAEIAALARGDPGFPLAQALGIARELLAADVLTRVKPINRPWS